MTGAYGHAHIAGGRNTHINSIWFIVIWAYGHTNQTGTWRGNSPVSCANLPWIGEEVLPRSFVLLSRTVGSTEGLSRTSQSAVMAALTRTAATQKEKGAL